MSVEQIEVSLGKSGDTRVFDSIQELETWLSQERQIWSWVAGTPYSNVSQTVSQRYENFFANMHQLVNEAKAIKVRSESSKQAPQFQDCFARIKTFFGQFYGQQFFPCSGTPFGKYVAQLQKDEGNAVAVGALAFSMRQSIPLNDVDSFRGALIGFAFETGIRERKINEAQALEQMRMEWEKKFQSFRDALQSETDTHQQLNSDAAKLIRNQETTFKELLTKQENGLKELVSNSQKDWTAMRKTYDDALALRSPVTYWTKKAQSHLSLSWIFAILSAAAAGASILCLLPEVKSMMEIPKGVQDPEKWHPEYWRMAILVASGLFCVWVVRILVRLFLSNVHLLTDARERVTMVQTYLALLRRGKLGDDERMFILQTLFRPTHTGIVKDDGVPLTIIEGITKLKN